MNKSAEAALPNLQITRTSAAEQVADALESAIFSGELLPDSPLREMALADAMSVSRNTIREGIRLLVTRGLVTHNHHRGASVVRLDPGDVADIYRVRRTLELSALRSEDPSDEHLQRLEAAAKKFKKAARHRDPQNIVLHDLEFHSSIVALLGSPRLDRFFQNIQTEMRLCLSIISTVDREYLRADDVAAEHVAIFDSYSSGRRDQATRLMRDHLDTNEERLKQISATRTEASGSGR